MAGIITDFTNLTKEDVIEEYDKLSNVCLKLKKSNEHCLQQIHELKRSLLTATNTESYLSAELDTITSVHLQELNELNGKHRCELEELRIKYAEQLECNSNLENDVDLLKKGIDLLKNELEVKQEEQVQCNANYSAKSITEKCSKLEYDNFKLTELVDQLRDQLQTAQGLNINKEAKIEELKDQLACVESTLQSKRDELEEQNQLIENIQERVFELTTELVKYQKEPDSDIKKQGNSLFAEVDDQRQRMKQILADQKKHYTQMKNDFNRSQQEIRALKYENTAMHKELQSCSSMFMNADQSFKDKFNERIGQLLTENEKLESKLKWTEAKLISLATDKGISWLDSMLSYCKTETSQYKSQLHSLRLQKSASDESLRNAEQETAKWRFEALKSRCLIINRETLLEEHKIPFDTDLPNIAKLVNVIDRKTKAPNINIGSSNVLDSNSAPKMAKLDELSQGSDCSITEIAITTAADVPTLCEMPASPVCTTLPLSKDNVDMDISLINETTDTTVINETIESAPPPPPPQPKQPFIPEYRKLSFTPEAMASLQRNIARLKPLEKSRSSSIRVAKGLFNVEEKKSVNFSDSTTMAEPKLLPVNAPKDDRANSATVIAKNGTDDQKSRPNQCIIKRVIVKSKKQPISCTDGGGGK